MSGMSGASMLRTRRKDVNVKPNRKLDRKSSRGMLYENEELRLRTININAEVERGQSDIKKLKRENDQLKREISALRYEYDKLDTLLRERKSSPEQSDDSASACSACAECASGDGSARAHVAFNDLSVVPEEDAADVRKSPTERPCSCEECSPSTHTNEPSTSQLAATTSGVNITPVATESTKRTVDVLVHDAPPEPPKFFEAIASPPFHMSSPPPPGFVIAPYQPSRFHNGGNVEDLLGDMQTSPNMQTTFIQQNSVFMCNTRRVTQQRPQCCCQRREPMPADVENVPPKSKSYVTEKNIELTYDYPRANPIPKDSPSPKSDELQTTTTEVASTVVFVERRIPVRPKKFDFFFRSRSAPVGETEEPIYATVNKLPKRLRRMELANLEKEVAYRSAEPDSSTRTEITLKTDSEHSLIAPPPDDDTSRSEREKTVPPQRPGTPKAKKRRRFSFTFKRKRRETKKEVKNGCAKNGGPVPMECDSERLLEPTEVPDLGATKPRHCNRHRPRNTMSSCSSGPRYKRDSYQEMTSHSEHERTNSVSSSVNSLASAYTHKPRKFSAPPRDGSIPWCGCWGAGCV